MVLIFVLQASTKKIVTLMVETAVFQLLMTNIVHLDQAKNAIATKTIQGIYHSQRVSTFQGYSIYLIFYPFCMHLL